MKVKNIFIDAEIGQGKGQISAKYIRSEMEDDSFDEYQIIVNSPGGDVYEGFSIYNILKDSDKKISAYIHGLCASIATLIVSAASEISISETAQWMIHRCSGGASGNSKDLKSAADAMSQIDTILAENYSKRTGKKIEEVYALMEATTYMKPDEAKSFGFVDSVRIPIAAFGSWQKNIIDDKKIIMKNKKNALAAAFKAIEDAITGKIKNAVEQLKDGTAIYVDGSVEVGSTVYTDEAYEVVLMQGSYELSDNRIIVIAGDDGVITEVVESEEVEVAASEEGVTTEALIEEITALKKENEALKANVDKAQEEMKALEISASAKLTTLKSMIENKGLLPKPQSASGRFDKDISAKLDTVAEKLKNSYKKEFGL